MAACHCLSGLARVFQSIADGLQSIADGSRKTDGKGDTKDVKRVYVDMDGVLVDFPERIEDLDSSIRAPCIEWCRLNNEHHSNYEGVFATFGPITDGGVKAVDAISRLMSKYEVYLLSTAPWKNTDAWSDKRRWISEHLPDFPKKRLILTHRTLL